MCGLVGIWGCKGPDEERRQLVHAMAETMVHRGPDGEGFVAREDCALGFRRLAIIDVTKRSDLARKYGVAVVPTAVAVEAGGVTARIAG